METSAVVIGANQDMAGGGIIQTDVPALLAWIHPDADCHPYQELLERVATTFSGQVQMYVFQQDCGSASGKYYGIQGTPTFVLVQAGRVTHRLFGEVDAPTLTAFIAQGVGKTQQPGRETG